jgi:hypothetical protein
VGLLFAYKSSDLCDGKTELPTPYLIVSWEHNWLDCPQDVVELRTVTQELTMPHTPRRHLLVPPSRQAARAATLRASPLQGLEDYLKRQSDLTRRLSRAVDAGIRAPYDGIRARMMRGRRGVGGVSYYTPDRLFFCTDFLHTGDGLTLSIFTGGQRWEGLNPSRSMPWSFCVVRTEADVPRVFTLAKVAYEARKRAR